MSGSRSWADVVKTPPKPLISSESRNGPQNENRPLTKIDKARIAIEKAAKHWNNRVYSCPCCHSDDNDDVGKTVQIKRPKRDPLVDLTCRLYHHECVWCEACQDFEIIKWNYEQIEGFIPLPQDIHGFCEKCFSNLNVTLGNCPICRK